MNHTLLTFTWRNHTLTTLPKTQNFMSQRTTISWGRRGSIILFHAIWCTNKFPFFTFQTPEILLKNLLKIPVSEKIFKIFTRCIEKILNFHPLQRLDPRFPSTIIGYNLFFQPPSLATISFSSHRRSGSTFSF